MNEADRRRAYQAAAGDDALARQLDEAKRRRRCCGTWKHEPHDAACKAGRKRARRAAR